MAITDPARCPVCDGRLIWGGMGYTLHQPVTCATRLRLARRWLLLVLGERVATPHSRHEQT